MRRDAILPVSVGFAIADIVKEEGPAAFCQFDAAETIARKTCRVLIDNGVLSMVGEGKAESPMKIRTVSVKQGKKTKIFRDEAADLTDAIHKPKEILVYKTTKAGWQKQFVAKGEPTTVPEDAIRSSIRFFSAGQSDEALEYWRLMEDDSYKHPVNGEHWKLSRLVKRLP